MTDYRWPVVEPEVVDSYVRELVEREARDGEKPTAFPTPFRASSSHFCGRSLVYRALKVAVDTPHDAGSLGIMDLGTLAHNGMQEAVQRRYPDAEIEVRFTIGSLVSGHADIFIPSRSEVLELKTVGRYAYEEAMGVKHPRVGQRSERYSPKGPKLSHITQAGLEAWGLGATNVRIGYINKESVSPALATRLGLTSLDRFMAEWVIPEAVWRPLAQQELNRLADLKAYVDAGFIPERVGVNDTAQQVILNPEALDKDRNYKASWSCRGYCQFRESCVVDGPAAVAVNIRAAS